MNRFVVVCTLLVGCGSEGGRGPIELDSLGMEIGLAGCAKQFECCSDVEIMELYMGLTLDGEPITTEGQCVELVTALFSIGFTEYQDSLALGRIAYDAAAAGGCVGAIEAVTCAQYESGLLPEASGCRPFIIPQVADGGGCTQDYECTSNNCAGEVVDQDGPSTDGACMPTPAEGESCDDNCADGLYCALDLSTGMETCQPLEPDGAECSLDRECASDHCDERTCATKPPVCTGD